MVREEIEGQALWISFSDIYVLPQAEKLGIHFQEKSAMGPDSS